MASGGAGEAGHRVAAVQAGDPARKLSRLADTAAQLQLPGPEKKKSKSGEGKREKKKHKKCHKHGHHHCHKHKHKRHKSAEAGTAVTPKKSAEQKFAVRSPPYVKSDQEAESSGGSQEESEQHNSTDEEVSRQSFCGNSLKSFVAGNLADKLAARLRFLFSFLWQLHQIPNFIQCWLNQNRKVHRIIFQHNF